MNHPSSPEQFRKILAARFGLRFDDGRLGFLGELLRRRAEARAMPVADYLDDIAEGAASEEAGLLADELTVGETYFFRNPDQLRALSDVVLPERMAVREGSRRLSFLCAGCSSGEEPFTLAMLAREAVPQSWDVAIRAIDLNPAALRKAASGRFSNWALRETPDEMRQRWFAADGRDVVLDRVIRAAVQFERRNLVDAESDSWPAETYDAIFCRNVIMYLTPAVQEAVIGRIAHALAPGGYLFLGHAETLRGLSQDFHLVHTHDTFYYQRKSAAERAARHHVDIGPTTPRPATRSPPATADVGWYETIGNASRRIEALALPALPLSPAPALPQWSLSVALDLLQRERFAEALALIDEMPSEARRDPDVLLLQAMLCVQGGKLAAAGEVCRLLLAQDELNAGANYVLALCFESVGDAKSAVHHYHLASHLDPEFAMPLLRRGLLARRSGELAVAQRDLGAALDLLKREDSSRLLLFGGGFSRQALSRLCFAEMQACEVIQ